MLSNYQLAFVYEGIEIDPDRIRQYFQEFGRVALESFVDFVSKHDQMIPERDKFKYHDETGRLMGETVYGPLPFAEGAYSDIFEVQEDLMVQNGNRNFLIFGNTAEGHFVVFDYSEDGGMKNPPVAIFLHDQLDQKGDFVKYRVAPSFEDFIHNLYE